MMRTLDRMQIDSTIGTTAEICPTSCSAVDRLLFPPCGSYYGWYYDNMEILGYKLLPALVGHLLWNFASAPKEALKSFEQWMLSQRLKPL